MYLSDFNFTDCWEALHNFKQGEQSQRNERIFTFDETNIFTLHGGLQHLQKSASNMGKLIFKGSLFFSDEWYDGVWCAYQSSFFQEATQHGRHTRISKTWSGKQRLGLSQLS